LKSAGERRGIVSFLFEKLEVYQKAIGLADTVSALTARFARPDWYLADQLNRASLSIALDLAEGNGRGTQADRRRFFLIARGSTLECIPAIEMCHRKRLLSPEACAQLRAELVDISKMLSGLIERTGGEVREEGIDYL
jgi:four helix bundle protein